MIWVFIVFALNEKQTNLYLGAFVNKSRCEKYAQLWEQKFNTKGVCFKTKLDNK